MKTRDIVLSDIATATPEGVEVCRIVLGEEEDPAAPHVYQLKFPPHVVVEPHMHNVSYCEIVLAGSQRVGKKWFHAGHARVVEGGTGYGPLESGDEGCTVIIVFAGGDDETHFLPEGKNYHPPVYRRG